MEIIGFGKIWLIILAAIEDCAQKEKLKKLGLFTGTKENCGDLIPAFVVQNIPVLIAGQITLSIRHESKISVMLLAALLLISKQSQIPGGPGMYWSREHEGSSFSEKLLWLISGLCRAFCTDMWYDHSLKGGVLPFFCLCTVCICTCVCHGICVSFHIFLHWILC